MRDERWLLGVDIGTSSAKCAVIRASDGHEVAVAAAPYRPDVPHTGRAEQDPQVWEAAAEQCIREALARAREQQGETAPAPVAGLGFSGQMHSTVLVNAGLSPVRPAILWLDTRSAPQVAELHGAIGREQVGRWTGNPLAAGFTLPTLMWLRENQPHVLRQAKHVLLPKDYVRARWTGEVTTDPGDASATGMFDVGRRAWSEEILNAAGINFELLPRVLPSAEQAGALLEPVAERLGLPAGLPIATGSGDQQSQAVGNGVIAPGLLSSTIGTGGQLFAPLPKYGYDPELRLHTYCHAVPGQWHMMAATLTAGMALTWFAERVLDGRPNVEELAGAAQSVPAGADGLFFLPHLAGERTPHMDPHARGTFHGLALAHGWQAMSRAVMEGVVFSLKAGLDLMRDFGVRPERVIASGGGTRHPLWLQLQADIYGLPVTRSKSSEAAALGAALLGGVASGVYADLAEACSAAVRTAEQIIEPRPDFAERYAAIYEAWSRLYPALREI